jgi:hypothetical protein
LFWSIATTLIIGGAAFFVAYRQYTISKAKLKFDLYEKRVALYQIARDFTDSLAVGGLAIGNWNQCVAIMEKAGTFRHDTRQCHFLFEEDVIAYFTLVHQNAMNLSYAYRDLDVPNLTEEDRDSLNRRVVALKTWFVNQSDEMIQVFRKDLSIKTLR